MKRKNSEKGMAAVEFALFLPVVMAMIMAMMEGGNAFHSYSTLLEASREGARMVLREGETTNVQTLVDKLTESLARDVTTKVTTDQVGKTVTVEVDYDYQSVFGENTLLASLGDSFVLRARTTMPLP